MSCEHQFSSGLLPLTGTPTVTDQCTLKIASAPYSSLQWALAGTAHTENDAIAWRSNCPPTLLIKEGLACGSLRAGRHLQLRNLLHAVTLRSIGFEHQGPVQLVMQLLYEAELNSNSQDWFRDAHADLGDEATTANDFTAALLEALTGYLDELQDNWEKDGALYVIILIAARVLSMSEGSNTGAAALLIRCRSVAFKWCARIDKAIADQACNAAPGISATQQLRTKTVDICAYATVTFAGSEMLLPDAAAVTEWLQLRARMSDNMLLGTSGAASDTGSFRAQLHRQAGRLALDLEGAVVQRIKADGGACISRFVSAHWSAAPDTSALSWPEYTSTQHHQWRVSTCSFNGVVRTLQVTPVPINLSRLVGSAFSLARE